MIKCFALNKKVMSKIKQRRLQILVHSCIYYNFDTTIVPDYKYDKWARELVDLQKRYPRESKEVKEYYKYFKDYDGSTGFDLPINSGAIIYKAEYLLRLNGVKL